MNKSFVGVEHLFLAIIRDRGAVPTPVLAGQVDLDRIDSAILDVLNSPAYNSSSRRLVQPE
jgi:hypothetical protein